MQPVARQERDAEAFESCNARRRKLEGVGECRLYAVGSEVVDGNPELEARYGRP